MPGRGAGHLLQYMREYNAESPKQGRKRFNYIVKKIYISYLPIIYLCSTHKYKGGQKRTIKLENWTIFFLFGVIVGFEVTMSALT